jgi:predicted XRE-type DNA-binding protein
MKREIFESVWDAIESDPAEAASLKARSSLLIAIQQTIDGWDLPAAAVAKRLAVTPARLKDIRRGNIDVFSLDDLMKLAVVAGISVTLEVVRPAA